MTLHMFSDESKARGHITAAGTGTATADFEYVHLLAAHDAVLWAADLAAWGWTRGGEYRAGMEPLVVARIRV